MAVVPDGISKRRRLQGWDQVDYGNAVLRTEPSVSRWLELVDDTRTAPAHVFSGLGAYPHVTRAMRYLADGAHKHIAVATEPWDPRGIKGQIRAVRFRTRRPLLTQVDTLLVDGRAAERQFIDLGFDPSRVARFGYFVDRVPLLPTSRRASPRVVFVGELAPRKDPVGLLRAFAGSEHGGATLTMIGDGPMAARVRAEIPRLHLQDRVLLFDRLANTAVRELVAQSDVLVLPSLYDGWGAVVNEALMSGTPAIVSSACGASELITSTLQGLVVDPGSLDSLTFGLNVQLGSGAVTSERRTALRAWAAAAISPDVAAHYLWQTLTRDDAQPIGPPPWQSVF